MARFIVHILHSCECIYLVALKLAWILLLVVSFVCLHLKLRTLKSWACDKSYKADIRTAFKALVLVAVIGFSISALSFACTVDLRYTLVYFFEIYLCKTSFPSLTINMKLFGHGSRVFGRFKFWECFQQKVIFRVNVWSLSSIIN